MLIIECIRYISQNRNLMLFAQTKLERRVYMCCIGTNKKWVRWFRAKSNMPGRKITICLLSTTLILGPWSLGR